MAEFRQSSVETAPPPHLAFGEYRFNPGTGELWRGGDEIRLTPRSAALLVALAERATLVVTKQELIARIWNGRAVGDDALTSCVQELRRVLGDDPRRPRLIETRHRRGYRLLVPVSTAEPPVRSAPATGATPPPPPLPERPSIEVLPFQNLSDDPEQEYFADGIVEDIIAALSRFRSLFVIARNSSFSYKGTSPNIRQVGRELGVRYVLEGGVRKAAGRIRITAQLIEAESGSHVWAEHYDRQIEDIFAVQEDVTNSIAGAIVPRIQASEVARIRRVRDLGAYEMAMMATSQHWLGLSGDPAPVEEARRLALEALALDDANLQALKILAASRVSQIIFGNAGDFDAAWHEGMQMAERAISVDPTDGEAYQTRGFLLIYAAGPDRIEEAMANLREAHALNPHSASVLYGLAFGEVCAGEPDETLRHAAEALRLSPRDPLKSAMYLMVSMAHFCLTDYLSGAKFARLGIAETNANASLFAHLAINLVGLGKVGPEAARAVTDMRRVSPAFAERATAGRMQYRNPEYLRRATAFLRVAAGLDDPKTIEDLR
jgi:TolB-like protein